jgi:hypothetical protein
MIGLFPSTQLYVQGRIDKHESPVCVVLGNEACDLVRTVYKNIILHL